MTDTLQEPLRMPDASLVAAGFAPREFALISPTWPVFGRTPQGEV